MTCRTTIYQALVFLQEHFEAKSVLHNAENQKNESIKSFKSLISSPQNLPQLILDLYQTGENIKAHCGQLHCPRSLSDLF